jgi:NADH-quinone oxidoreductase subunit J
MIAFWVLAVVLVASAIWTVVAPRPVYSVVGLLVHFAMLAIMFVTLSAEFLAMMQIIVYSGAILILFVFVIALLSSGVAPFSAGPDRMPKARIPAVISVLIALGFLVYAIVRQAQSGYAHAAPAVAASASSMGPVGTAGVFGSVADFGNALFTVYLLPFEVTAFILMVAVVGVVLLAGDQSPHVPVKRRGLQVDREMREAILREGGP